MYKKVIFFLSSLLAVSSLIAQEYMSPCGTVGALAEPVIERLLQNKEFLKHNSLQFRDEVTYVPIKFHLTSRNDGSQRVLERRVLDQLCALNEDYADMDIQFYIHNGFNYLNNTAVFENHGSTINTIMSFNRDPGAINIWIVKDASPPGEQGIGTTLGYYFPPSAYDWIVVRKDEVGAQTSTLPHEVGHFFSLPHPHNGWDAEPWTSPSPAPAISSGGVATERADGSNCATAGDFLCDTPADYNGFGWPDCNYTGGTQDPTGVEIDPEEKLFMGYFLNCPRDEYFFSQEQQDLIVADLLSPQRNYVRPGITPNTTAITESPELIAPVGGSGNVVEGYNAVNFEWTPVAGADAYLLEIGIDPSFNPGLNPFSIIVFGNSKVVNGLNPDRLYYWRARPFNDYYTCQPASSFDSFKTGTTTVSTNSIPSVATWSVHPNPVRRKGEMSISLQTRSSFTADIRLYNTAGQIVQPAASLRFETGDNVFHLKLNDLEPGIYLLTVLSSTGKLNRRFIVSP